MFFKREEDNFMKKTEIVKLFGRLLAFSLLVPSSILNAADAVFHSFEYRGEDAYYAENPLEKNEFYTPILQGCYPDPSICKKGDDYYLVASSFAFNPGVPIFHSKDLVNWKQIGHVLERPEQLDVRSSGIALGVYAPVIRYNKHNDTFYMITTQLSGGFGNIIVKTKDPMKGWSDAIKLDFGGIDPDIFFDDDGKAYIVHNDAPVKELYSGHRAIWIRQYDVEKDRVFGEPKVIVDGGVDISKKPIWIEAPHIYKKNGKYYLMCAEGGTGGAHSEVIFKSDNVMGPYVPAEKNPILTQRHLPQERPDKIDWAGHADLVEGPDGKYYAVFLGVRPNEKNRVNTGRETFIIPVDWTGEWPVYEGGLEPLPVKYPMPKGAKNMAGKKGFFPNGNFVFKDDFKGKDFDMTWVGMRGPVLDFAEKIRGGVKISPFDVSIKEARPTSCLFRRQQHNSFTATASMSYIPESERDLAGMVCYQSEDFCYTFGITKKGGAYYILLERTEARKGEGGKNEKFSTIIASEKIQLKQPVFLQVKANGDEYSFNYSLSKNKKFKTLASVSGDILSTNVAGGFTGAFIGLYATSKNDAVPENR